jgi:hypothetical protein
LKQPCETLRLEELAGIGSRLQHADVVLQPGFRHALRHVGGVPRPRPPIRQGGLWTRPGGARLAAEFGRAAKAVRSSGCHAVY